MVPFLGAVPEADDSCFSSHFGRSVYPSDGDPDCSNRRGRQAEGDKQLTGQAEGDEQLSADNKDNCADKKT